MRPAEPVPYCLRWLRSRGGNQLGVNRDRARLAGCAVLECAALALVQLFQTGQIPRNGGAADSEYREER